MKAIILAGGRGTRFAPLTDTIPKALLSAGSKTLMELAIEQLPPAIDTVIVVKKYLGNLIEEKLGNRFNGRAILYSTQPADRDGTWPAFYCAKEHIQDTERFCVLGCDDFFSTADLQHALDQGKPGMGVTETTMPAKYHAIQINEKNIITGLQRHPNENREELVVDTFANGFFILDASVFSFEPVKLIDNEYGLPQTLLAHPKYPLQAFELPSWQPCNTFEDLEKLK